MGGCDTARFGKPPRLRNPRHRGRLSDLRRARPVARIVIAGSTGHCPNGPDEKRGLTSRFFSSTQAIRRLGRGRGRQPSTRRLALALAGAILALVLCGAPNAVAQETPSSCANQTFPGFSSALPDCRAYELVSNPIDETYLPEADGEQIGGTAVGTGEYVAGNSVRAERPFQASPDGERLAYAGGESNSGEGGTGQSSDGFGNQYLAVRGAAGWQTSDISLPTANLVALPVTGVFSPDLSVSTVEALLSTTTERVSAEPEAAPECIENQLASTYSSTAGGALRALITAIRPGSFECDAWPAAISADDSHILLDSRGAYTAGAVEGSNEQHRNLYDSVNGSLHQVNILPAGEPEPTPSASFGVTLFPGSHEWSNFDGVISADGSRVVWSSMGEEYRDPKALYVRENDAQPQSPVAGGQCTTPGDACTVQLDVTQGGTGASGGGFFWGARDGGSKVFFTDCSRLTADSTANFETACLHEPIGPGGREEVLEAGAVFTGSDLYEYDFKRPLGQRLVDLTVDHSAGDARGADVQGVLGASQDGGDVYFVANGVLSGANAQGQAPVAGQPNLYLAHGATTTFIATLAQGDNATSTRGSGNSPHPPPGDWSPPLGWRSAQVSAGGGAVAFESRQQLTGYDSLGQPEVFVYQVGSGRLTCVSCDPSGAPPDPSLATGPHGTQLRGAFLAASGRPSFQTRSIVEREGTQVYFMTSQPLVAYDRNGLQDVYEWESDGSGACRQAAGCITLISDAGTQSNSYFIESGGDGRDVFFTTRSQLTPAGVDEKLKLYDARIGGGRPEPSQACTGTGCQGVPPAPPPFATPSSVTLNGGVGNFAPSAPQIKPKPKPKPKSCKRGFRRRHNRCVRSKARKAAKRHASQQKGGRHHG